MSNVFVSTVDFIMTSVMEEVMQNHPNLIYMFKPTEESTFYIWAEVSISDPKTDTLEVAEMATIKHEILNVLNSQFELQLYYIKWEKWQQVYCNFQIAFDKTQIKEKLQERV